MSTPLPPLPYSRPRSPSCYYLPFLIYPPPSVCPPLGSFRKLPVPEDRGQGWRGGSHGPHQQGQSKLQGNKAFFHASDWVCFFLLFLLIFPSLQGRILSLICCDLYVLYDLLAHVAGWEPCYLLDLYIYISYIGCCFPGCICNCTYPSQRVTAAG